MTSSLQRGASTVIVTLLLLAAALLGLLAANRQLLLELRLSGNQVRSAEAFEAAEAGLDWATALLNSPLPVADDCRPATGATQNFRARHLAIDATRITPAPVFTGCTQAGGGWTCHCAAAAAVAPSSTAPGFSVRLADAGRPGLVRLIADGDGPPDAVARTQVLLALQPALPAPPLRALSLRDPAQPADSFFVQHFGVSRAAWGAQPVVQHLACSGDCGAALRAALGDERRPPLLQVDGDLLLRGPLALGSAERPVLIVVRGRLQLEGAVSLNGLLYAADIGWAAPAAALRGALLSEGAAAGSGVLDLTHDAALLDLLRTRQGSFIRVPGSWRDF